MSNDHSDEASCPCGSDRALATCCGPYLAGDDAPTAEASMRSRYTAYVLGDEAHVLRTWHRRTRPATADLAAGPRWVGLDIIRCEEGGAGDRRGTVEFKARFVQGRTAAVLHEVSRFERDEDRWYYVDGTLAAPRPRRDGKVGRNTPCPCGSGRKFKRCCGA